MKGFTNSQRRASPINEVDALTRAMAANGLAGVRSRAIDRAERNFTRSNSQRYVFGTYWRVQAMGGRIGIRGRS